MGSGSGHEEKRRGGNERGVGEDRDYVRLRQPGPSTEDG